MARRLQIPHPRSKGVAVDWDGGLHLTSKGVERVTVGELRLRGRRTWGSWRWLLEALEEALEEGEGAGVRAEVAPDGDAAPAEVLGPSSVSCRGEKHFWD